MNKDKVTSAVNSALHEICEEKGMHLSDFDLNENLNLLESGICDSLGLLQLIATVEDTLEMEIDLSEEDPEKFTNYTSLIELIAAIE